MSTPVIVLSKADACGWCTKLAAFWDTPPNMKTKSAVQLMKQIHPSLRTFIAASKDMSGNFDESIVPYGMKKYVSQGSWFPMILLVPGPVWDNAIKHIGDKSDIPITDGVQIFNGFFDDNGFPSMDRPGKYEMTPEGIAAWFKVAIINPEFQRVQNALPISTTYKSKIIQQISQNNELKNSNQSVCSMNIIPRRK